MKVFIKKTIDVLNAGLALGVAILKEIKTAISPYAKRLLKWLKNNVCRIVIALAVFAFLGSLGAYEIENITGIQACFQCIICILVIVIVLLLLVCKQLIIENIELEYKLHEDMHLLEKIYSDLKEGVNKNAYHE